MTTSCDSERLLTFSEAARLPWLPRRNGKKIHTVTFWRWSRKGCAGVILSVSYVGSLPTVTESALRQFFRDVAEAKRLGNRPAPTYRTPTQRVRAFAAAERRLDEAGII